MATNYHHGVSGEETTDTSTIINDIDSAVIGVVCTADDADAATFPLNTPVLLTRVKNVLGKAGKTGTLRQTLKAISDQASPQTVVVRVAEGGTEEGEKSTETNVIGGVDENGLYTGLYALLVAEMRVGVKPRIIGAPGLDTLAVANQIAIFARELKAFAYISANGCKTIAEAKIYRKNFIQREVMVIYPDWLAYDSEAESNVVVPAPAYALGLRAKIDADIGWHKTLSNVAVDGVLGTSADIYFSLQGKDTDADELNSNHITTLIKQKGFRFWGSRTCEEEVFIFESYTRTAQILLDTVAEAHFYYIDKPLTPSLAKDVIDGINRKLSAYVTAGRLLGARCWYDTDVNTIDTLKLGKLTIRYNYTPVPPLENLGLIQEFTDDYFASFANAVNS
ncbi:phage tail sheath protein [Yersinia enterocolitica]|uniref:phage tail sheath protein n=1 Tax=Yersinia enterocolitica TaxID=630 RepID=UPI0005E3796E|nr:phage tail sheath protein [Yersinia enterocolitica]CNK69868.1 major tail sheath protein [Yersinia enterocolitica]